MPPSPIQIKDKLLTAIDGDNNIVDSSLVLEVITQLEKTVVTREDLEATRLGLYINSLRKKTADQELAKRCRKLVKAWQQLANSSPSSNASPAYYSPALNVSKQPSTASAYAPSSSPALQAANIRRTSPATVQNATIVPGRLVSPLVRGQSGRNSPATAQVKRISPSNSRLTAPKGCAAVPAKLSISPNQSSSRPSTPNNISHVNNSARSYTPTPVPANNHSNFTPHLDTTNRTHAANKKRRRSEESANNDGSSLKKARPVINGDATRLTERIKVPKVKTTAQLIEELQFEKSTRLTKSDTINKIVTNQIKKEEDDINLSVVPASARPKSRGRKNASTGLPNPPADLSKAKSELVERYLETHIENKHTDDVDVDIDVIGDKVDTNEINNCFQQTNSSSRPRIDMTIDPYSLLPPLDYDNIPWSDDDEDTDMPIKRNPITGEYPDGYEPPDSCSGTPDDTTVNKVINADWNGVNGTVNVNSEFHTWTETFSILDDSEKADRHVLLPYVDI